MTNESSSPLLAQVRQLATDARAAVPSLANEYDTLLTRIDQPLRVAIVGKVKAGKSTLLNALLGEELAASDAGECTRIVTWYQHGEQYLVTAEAGSESSPVPFTHQDGRLDIDLEGRDHNDVNRLLIEAPADELRSMSLIDTPGMASLSNDISAKSSDFLTPDDGSDTPVDAVIYLLRHLQATDVSFLRAFRDSEFITPSPVNCLAVLSRADEVASGRLDAIESAQRIATRYSADVRLRRLVQSVVPVAGLVGRASASITATDVAHVQSIADLEPARAQLLLLSVDRFLDDTSLAMTAEEREHLLDLLGLFGLRLLEAHLRESPTDLAGVRTLLRNKSGIGHLQAMLHTLFGGRRDTLKARSALVAIQRLLDEVEHPREISAEVERIWASAHEFSELRALNTLRESNMGLSDEQRQDAERILGGQGADIPSRLGWPDAQPHSDEATALLETISRWRQIGENPIAPRSVKTICDVVIRSCEGLYAQR